MWVSIFTWVSARQWISMFQKCLNSSSKHDWKWSGVSHGFFMVQVWRRMWARPARRSRRAKAAVSISCPMIRPENVLDPYHRPFSDRRRLKPLGPDWHPPMVMGSKLIRNIAGSGLPWQLRTCPWHRTGSPPTSRRRARIYPDHGSFSWPPTPGWGPALRPPQRRAPSCSPCAPRPGSCLRPLCFWGFRLTHGGRRHPPGLPTVWGRRAVTRIRTEPLGCRARLLPAGRRRTGPSGCFWK